MHRSDSDSRKDPERIVDLERELARTRAELTLVRAALAERTRAELADRRAQRLEALGHLSAGVAHEINTPMQFISDHVHFLRDGLEGTLVVVDRLRAVRDAARAGAVDPALIARADQAELDADLDYLRPRLACAIAVTLEGVERVSEIVAAMRVFTHPREDVADVDLHQVLATTLTVARAAYHDVADVRTEWGALPLVLGHAGDLNLAFLELIVNAARALAVGAQVRGGRRGTLTVRTRGEGRAVLVEIADTGVGMSAEARARIFDPARGGAGHGLATALAVIERHCGQLEVDSAAGLGTTVRVRLPVAGPETLRGIRRVAAPPPR